MQKWRHNNGCPPLLHLDEQKLPQPIIRTQIFGSQGHFCHPGSHKLLSSCSRSLSTTGSKGGVAATVVTKMYSIYHTSPTSSPLLRSCKPSIRLHSSKIAISDTFCHCSCCLGRETDSCAFYSSIFPESSSIHSVLREP